MTRNNLLSECAQGFASDPDFSRNPYRWSSDSWLAYEAGAALSSHFVPTQTHIMPENEPSACSKSRGYSVKIRTRAGAEFIYCVSGDRDLLDNRSLTPTSKGDKK